MTQPKQMEQDPASTRPQQGDGARKGLEGQGQPMRPDEGEPLPAPEHQNARGVEVAQDPKSGRPGDAQPQRPADKPAPDKTTGV